MSRGVKAFSAEVASGSAQENATNREIESAIRFPEIGSRLSAGLLAVFAALGLSTLSAFAHHSLAPYDRTVSRTIEGVVKDYSFSNPHVKLVLAVSNPNGSTTDWRFESTNVSRMMSRGFNRVSARIGDRITVSYNPLRSGAAGGMFTGFTDSRGVSYGPIADR